MSNGSYLAVAIVLPIVLVSMRWAHRSWGKAFLSTFFAPLVAVPLYFVGFLAFGFLLRVVNAPLEAAGYGISTRAIGSVAIIATTALLLALFVHYLRDQRHVSRIETGPRLGPCQTFQSPKMGLKTRIR